MRTLGHHLWRYLRDLTVVKLLLSLFVPRCWSSWRILVTNMQNFVITSSESSTDVSSAVAQSIPLSRLTVVSKLVVKELESSWKLNLGSDLTTGGWLWSSLHPTASFSACVYLRLVIQEEFGLKAVCKETRLLPRIQEGKAPLLAAFIAKQNKKGQKYEIQKKT